MVWVAFHSKVLRFDLPNLTTLQLVSANQKFWVAYRMKCLKWPGLHLVPWTFSQNASNFIIQQFNSAIRSVSILTSVIFINLYFPNFAYLLGVGSVCCRMHSFWNKMYWSKFCVICCEDPGAVNTHTQLNCYSTQFAMLFITNINVFL